MFPLVILALVSCRSRQAEALRDLKILRVENEGYIFSGYISDNNLRIVKLLLEAGQDPNQTFQTTTDDTPLCIAASYASPEMIKLLIDYGANVNPLDPDYNPLHCAIREGKFENFKVLIAAGAKVDTPELRYGRKLILDALSRGQTKMAEYLIRHGVKPYTGDKEFDFVFASGLGNCRKLKELMSQGVSANCRPKERYPEYHPFDFAVANNQLQAVELLLKHGAKINGLEIEYKPNTPLGSAIEHGHPQMIDLLLKYGADVNITSGLFKNTPLIIAARKGDLDTVKKLVARGANCKTRNSFDLDAAYFALGYGHFKVAEYLYKLHPAVNIIDFELMTPLNRAIQNNKLELCKLFLKLGANPNQIPGKKHYLALFTAVDIGNLEIIKLLLKNKADTNILDLYGQKTPLIHMIKDKDHDLEDHVIVKLLLENGADPNKADKSGWTPLMHAAKQNCGYCTELLLIYGANPNLKNKSGQTAADIAKKEKNREVLKVLKQAKFRK